MKKFTASLILILVINSIAYCQLPATNATSENQTTLLPDKLVYGINSRTASATDTESDISDYESFNDSIILVSDKPEGSNFYFKISTKTANTECTVDFGTGKIYMYTIGISLIKIHGALGPDQTVIIKSNNIENFYCVSNEVTKIDVSSCYNLRILELGSNRLNEIELSSNKLIQVLNIESNKITVLKLTGCDSLNLLNCKSNLLKSINVGANKKLAKLICDNNMLANLCLASNQNLKSLICNNNYLSMFYLDTNNYPLEIECMNNNFKYSTLPPKDAIAGYYKYAPQKPIEINTGLIIDLSSEYSINKYFTTYTWVTQSGDTLVEGDDYSTDKGVTRFLKVPEDSVFCQMKNTAFPNFCPLPLTTNLIKVPHLSEHQTITMLSEKKIGDTVSFKIGLDQYSGSQIFIDFGDGIPVDRYSMFNINEPLQGNGPIIIYATHIDIFECEENLLSSLDVTNAPQIRVIEASNNKLTDLDLSNNTKLSHLYIGNNFLEKLDLSNNPELSNLHIDNNLLKKLDLSNNPGIQSLTCRSNQITEIDLTNTTRLMELYCGNNLLKTINTVGNKRLYYVFCENNNLEKLEFDGWASFEMLNIKNNRLSFSTLISPERIACWDCPLTMELQYSYAPQQALNIENNNGLVDLSSEYKCSNSFITNYTWKTISENTLLEGTDYTISEGNTKFLTPQNDSVYCEMTNDYFPFLTGDNNLKTINIVVPNAYNESSITKEESIMVDLNSSNKTLQERGFKPLIYSSSNILKINTPVEAELLIIDLNGKIEINELKILGEREYPITNPGIYIVKLISEDESYVQKVIIK